MDLEQKQQRLKLNVIDYDLDKMWRSHALVNELRERMKQFFPTGLYDPQDLEHQVLFRLTTFDPKEITDETIKSVVDEQYLIIEDRLNKLNYDRAYLFRGLSGKYHDLNIYNRLTLQRERDGKLVARNQYHSFSIEFKLVRDERIISLFTSELHYIHQDRPKGETFGFYFSGDEIPWAIETTEPSIIAKEYKRDALLAFGIDPNKAIELTRFYMLPGAPLNAISMIDGCVANYYKPKGIQALMTTTMPMYSKTKSATIAGGINNVLLVKDLVHKFIPVTVQGKICYRQVTNDYLESNHIANGISSHPNFPMLFTVEVYMIINEPALKPLKVFENKNKVLYVKNREYVKDRDTKVEKEVKFLVKDIPSTLNAVRRVARFSHVEYLRDVIYGLEGKKKIRLRVCDRFTEQSFNVMYKYKVVSEEGVKTEIEETLYDGNSLNEALEAIGKQGEFKEENSYEKIRAVYLDNKISITLDVYPYGVWVEIEGATGDIWSVANKLGYSKEDSVTKNADELYVEWNKEKRLEELWDVRFGLDKQNPLSSLESGR